MSVPKTTKVWTVQGKNDFESLKLDSSKEIPTIADNECLVKIQGASLNYRDLIIPKGKYPFPSKDGEVPGSDGAGTVVSVGKNVKRFKAGDKVITLFNQSHLGGSLNALILQSGIGGAIDGTLRQYGAFDENGLVRMPNNLNFMEASTLTCAGLTAWNALFGLEGRQLKPGDWVLTQGTGGVSIFAVQFAKACGAKVVATTGTDSKSGPLKKLGADHVLNYKNTPAWGEAAKALTPEGRGFDHIVEVAGPASMRQSLNAIAPDGVIAIIGFLGGGKGEDQPSFLDALTKMCVVRGIYVGSRVLMEDMCRAVEANDHLKPVMDPKVFGLEEVKEAYQHMWDQKHFGKIGIEIE